MSHPANANQPSDLRIRVLARFVGIGTTPKRERRFPIGLDGAELLPVLTSPKAAGSIPLRRQSVESKPFHRAAGQATEGETALPMVTIPQPRAEEQTDGTRASSRRGHGQQPGHRV
jgi:hypothetical protein